MITITKEGYFPVQCDEPLPCPFCGAAAELAQVAHETRSERIGRSRKQRQVRYAIIASTTPLAADTFWFKCPGCNATTGGHHGSAQKAAEAWNRRAELGERQS
jgi:hypothetical protein